MIAATTTTTARTMTITVQLTAMATVTRLTCVPGAFPSVQKKSIIVLYYTIYQISTSTDVKVKGSSRLKYTVRYTDMYLSIPHRCTKVHVVNVIHGETVNGY